MISVNLVLPFIGGLLGATIGSFLNVVIHRLPREGLKVSHPRRSFCPQCKAQLRWFENLPVLSWTLQGGRCRHCQAPIPARYVVVEVLTALLFGVFTSRHLVHHPDPWQWQSMVVLVAGLYLGSVCIAVTYIDLDFRIIPDEITWSGMGLGVLVSLVAPLQQADSWPCQRLMEGLGWNAHVAGGASALLGAGTGALVVLGVGWLGSLAFRKEAMGLGDVKYMGLVGAFLGADGVLLVFLLGCLTGAVGGLIHRAITGDRYIAFGPYLSLGTVLVLLYRTELVHFFLVGWPSLVRRMIGAA